MRIALSYYIETGHYIKKLIVIFNKIILYARHYNLLFVYFYPLLQEHLFVFKGDLAENSVLMYVLCRLY